MLKDRINYTSRGFDFVEVSPQEVFNWGGVCICNGCYNQFLNENMFLVFVLGDTYCKKCFNDWLLRQEKYSQNDVDYDLLLQKNNSYNFYKFYLKK